MFGSQSLAPQKRLTDVRGGRQHFRGRKVAPRLTVRRELSSMFEVQSSSASLPGVPLLLLSLRA
jgi:hypothetical protein